MTGTWKEGQTGGWVHWVFNLEWLIWGKCETLREAFTELPGQNLLSLGSLIGRRQYPGVFSYPKALPFPEGGSKYTRKSLTISFNPDIEHPLSTPFMKCLWHLGVL